MKKDLMVLSGEMPWAGNSVQVSMDQEPLSMLQTAKLDWHLRKQAMHSIVQDTDGSIIEVPIIDHYALIRSGDNQVLGICGKDYEPFQNREVMEFFHKFTSAGKMKMQFVGSMQNGKYIWAMAKINHEFVLPGNDVNLSYILMISPHIWGKALTIVFTNIRVYCYNMMNRALSGKLGERFRLLHTRTFPEMTKGAQDIVQQAIILDTAYADQAKFLASKEADKDQVLEYVARVVSPKALSDEGLDKYSLNDAARRVLYNYEHGPGAHVLSAEGTWWGALNAVTRYVDHQAGRSGADRRLYDAWVGPKARLKTVALDLAITYANAA